MVARRNQGKKRPSKKQIVRQTLIGLRSRHGCTPGEVATRIKRKYGAKNVPKHFKSDVCRTIFGLKQGGKVHKIRGKYRFLRKRGRKPIGRRRRGQWKINK